MQGQKHSIKDWAKDDKPREKLLSKNPAALSDSELLAILIGRGTREHSAIDLAKQVLKLGKDNLLELGKLTVPQLMNIKGIGQAKAITIVAAMELGRRRQVALSLDRPLIKNSREVAGYLQIMLRDLRREVFGVIYLNSAGKILLNEIVTQPPLTRTASHPPLTFKKALLHEPPSLLLYPTHPSHTL